MVINRFADGGKFLLINTLIWDEIRIPIKTPTVLYEINIWIELNKSFDCYEYQMLLQNNTVKCIGRYLIHVISILLRPIVLFAFRRGI